MKKAFKIISIILIQAVLVMDCMWASESLAFNAEGLLSPSLRIGEEVFAKTYYDFYGHGLDNLYGVGEDLRVSGDFNPLLISEEEIARLSLPKSSFAERAVIKKLEAIAGLDDIQDEEFLKYTLQRILSLLQFDRYHLLPAVLDTLRTIVLVSPESISLLSAEEKKSLKKSLRQLFLYPLKKIGALSLNVYRHILNIDSEFFDDSMIRYAITMGSIESETIKKDMESIFQIIPDYRIKDISSRIIDNFLCLFYKGRLKDLVKANDNSLQEMIEIASCALNLKERYRWLTDNRSDKKIVKLCSAIILAKIMRLELKKELKAYQPDRGDWEWIVLAMTWELYKLGRNADTIKKKWTDIKEKVKTDFISSLDPRIDSFWVPMGVEVEWLYLIYGVEMEENFNNKKIREKIYNQAGKKAFLMDILVHHSYLDKGTWSEIRCNDIWQKHIWVEVSPGPVKGKRAAQRIYGIFELLEKLGLLPSAVRDMSNMPKVPVDVLDNYHFPFASVHMNVDDYKASEAILAAYAVISDLLPIEQIERDREINLAIKINKEKVGLKPDTIVEDKYLKSRQEYLDIKIKSIKDLKWIVNFFGSLTIAFSAYRKNSQSSLGKIWVDFEVELKYLLRGKKLLDLDEILAMAYNHPKLKRSVKTLVRKTIRKIKEEAARLSQPDLKITEGLNDGFGKLKFDNYAMAKLIRQAI